MYTHIHIFIKYVYPTGSLQNSSFLDLINVLSPYFSLTLKILNCLRAFFSPPRFHFSIPLHPQIMKDTFYSLSSTVVGNPPKVTSKIV